MIYPHWGDGLRFGLELFGYRPEIAKRSVRRAWLAWRSGVFALALLPWILILLLSTGPWATAVCDGPGPWYCTGEDPVIAPVLILGGLAVVSIFAVRSRAQTRRELDPSASASSRPGRIALPLLVAAQFWPVEFFLQRHEAFLRLPGVPAVLFGSILLGLGLLMRLSADHEATRPWVYWLAVLALVSLSIVAIPWSPVLLSVALAVALNCAWFTKYQG